MPLLNKNCVKASPREQNRQQEKIVSSADVNLESAYPLSVKDVLDAEVQLEQGSRVAEAMEQGKASKLWIW